MGFSAGGDCALLTIHYSQYCERSEHYWDLNGMTFIAIRTIYQSRRYSAGVGD